MIKANDLRVGNFIKFNNHLEKEKIVQVNLRFFASWAGGRNPDEMKVDEEISNYYTEIELTPDILQRCGFDWSIYHQAFHKENFELDINECYPKGYALCRFKRTGEPVVPNLFYLHQLQNAYYVLTGSELDVVW